ncbi:MAG TPA: endo-1,4-beta-xylanase [Terriglobales bacterium]|nr:endo-1,4-beta-xylanase [Terriglobales bacterium]
MLCRRLFLLLKTVVILLALGQAAAGQLRSLADRAGILLGTAVRSERLSEPPYSSTLTREFNMLEPEDAMKWFVLRPNSQTFDFGPADRIVAFAQANGMKIRGHTLLWARQNPQWLLDGNFREKELLEILKAHITGVVGHYRGKVFAWDVVNEAFDESGNLRDSIWYNQPGIGLAEQRTAYIEKAFRLAHTADPDALLFYNDAEGETMNPKSDAIYAMVKDFRSRGVPIHGIGLQMHVASDPRPNIASIRDNIVRLGSLGVQVHITELDVALPVDAAGLPLHNTDLTVQAAIYRELLRACLEQPHCTAFQTWGFTDRYSWLQSSSHGSRGAGLLFNRQYRPKANCAAIRDELRRGR